MLRERKSADLSTAISLKSWGEQCYCLSYARISTIGRFFGLYVGSELKNRTRRNTRSKLQLRYQIGPEI